MARVQIAMQSWGCVQDPHGNVRPGYTITLTTLTGGAATVYAASTGVTTTTPVTDSDGYVAGWVNEGSYVANGRQVEAARGATTAVLAEAPINVDYPEYNGDIQAALNALPPFSGGIGGGVVYVPPGNRTITSTITLPAGGGVRLVGDGRRATYVHGSIVGALVTTPTDGTNAALLNYSSIENIFLHNTSSDTAARCLDIRQVNIFGIKGCIILGIGKSMADFTATYKLSVDGDTRFGGAVGADWCVRILPGASGSACTLIKFDGSSFTDAKMGILAQRIYQLNIVNGCDFQNLSGPTADGFAGVISMSGILGGQITNNYFENCVASAYAFYNNVGEGGGTEPGASAGMRVGGNFITSSGASYAGQIPYVTDSLFSGDHVYPGAGSVNINGLYTSTGTKRNMLQAPRIRTGTGVGLDLAASLAAGEVNEIVRYSFENLSIASATALPLPTDGNVFTVTGTTTVTSMTPARAGRVVTLVFAGILTFTDGSNLKLNGNFVTTADDTITLASDGTNWFEIARSVN